MLIIIIVVTIIIIIIIIIIILLLKGNYWMLSPESVFNEMFEKGNFQRRKRRRTSYDRSRGYNRLQPIPLQYANGRSHAG